MGNKGLRSDTTEKHECYGMVGINRCSSTGTYLFGSLAKHSSFITLEIRRASVTRHLASDWYHAESLPLIEIELSHSQFGELITSPGVGNGVPCTIRQISGESQGECPRPQPIVTKFDTDLKATTRETVLELEALRDQLKESLLPGNKPLNKTEQKELLQKINSAIQSVTDSIPFIEKSFRDDMEKEVDRAVTELEGTAAHMLHNIAEQAIANHVQSGGALPTFRAPMLGTGKEEEKA